MTKPVAHPENRSDLRARAVLTKRRKHTNSRTSLLADDLLALLDENETLRRELAGSIHQGSHQVKPELASAIERLRSLCNCPSCGGDSAALATITEALGELDGIQERLDGYDDLLGSTPAPVAEPHEIRVPTVNEWMLGAPDTRSPCCWQCTPDYRCMLLCATCGNKRCPHASNHLLACTNSNEPGQPGSVYQATFGGVTAASDPDPTAETKEE